jgi:roadblock/LC7 domain-containing protein
MKDSLNTLKELASSVRNATKEGENSAERIGRLFEGILEYIKTPESIENYFELKQDGNGLDYIYTKYNIASAGALSMYASDKINIPSIYDGLPIDNDTIYWHEVDGSKVLKAKGRGGEAGSVQWDNISGKPSWIEDTKPSYSWSDITGEKPFYTKEEIASKYVTIDTEQEITALKHFTAGLSVGESKKKIYEENGVVYIDADVAVTGAMTFYASAGRSVSTIMDGVTVDEETITKGSDNVLRIKNAGAGSSFDENAMWSALSGSSDNQINKSHLTTALDGYATQNWVIENYATKSELSAVSNKLNDFLEGSDTDSIINKWKELEAFLSGMAETDNLAEILKTKADKSYVDSTFVTLGTKQTITGEKTFSSVLNTAAIKASGAITAPSLAASDWVTIAGIKLRKLEDGALMLEGNLALTGALTMYASNGQSFDTIYDGLPIDNDTIYWQEVDGSRVLKAREGSGSSFDKSAMWTALAGSTTEQINKSHLTTALTGYATESWVSGKNYAVKATTLAGYGITDAYTKTESDNKYPTKTGSGASGTWGINVTGNAGSATKLQTARTLWGRSFDGTGNVSGNLDSVGNITGSGTIDVITKNNQNIRFKINNDDTLSVLLELKSFRPFGAASNSINLGLSDAKWKDLYLGGNANIDGVTKTGDFYIGGIRLHKTADGVITLEGNLAVTGGVTMYAIDPVSASTIMDGVVVDGVTIKKENGKLVAVGGGEAGSVAWGNISGKPSVFPTNIANITDLHSSWDSVLAAQKPAWLTAVSIATISDLNSGWDALLKAAPSAYVTRWPTISEVTGKQNLIVKLNGGTTEGTNQFTYNATGAKTINITPAGIGAATSGHTHAMSAITDLHSNWDALLKAAPSSYVTRWPSFAEVTSKPSTLSGYGITDAYTKTESDNKYPTKAGSGANGTWGINVTGNSGSATKLQTTCNLWGHSFNGQQNISGDLTGVGKIKYNNGEYFDEYGNMHLPTSLEKNYWTIFNSNGAELIKVNGIGGIIGSAFRADNWYRSTGNTGWQNETYGGGWYMQDSSYIRSYNNKSIHIGSGSYISANGGYKVNNDANTSEVWNCRYIVESLSVPAGNVRNILGWYDSSSSGYTTSYIIGSKREVGNNWGELMLGVYQYEDAKRSVAVYMGLDGAGGKVYIGGNLLVTGGGTFYGSDIRYKSIMQQVNLSLLDIANAPSFVYHWNKEGMKRDRLNLGGSAQYTQSVLPWAVEENDNFLSMDYATVAYTFAVHAARHLLTYETRTDKKIKKLEREIVILKKQLKKLGYEEVRTLDDSGI